MAQPSSADIIKTNPIGDGLNTFRDNLTLTYKDSGLPCSIDTLRQLDSDGSEFLQNLRAFLTLSSCQKFVS
jgi:hypothetical protein